MTTCDKCGRETRQVVPWLRPTSDQKVQWNPFNRHQVLSRAAHEALGIEIPWGEHPDDDRFGQVCPECAVEITTAAAE